jgi:hypothetical protein
MSYLEENTSTHMFWLDFLGSGVACILLVIAGLMLRRYIAARKRHRPIVEMLGKEWFQASRFSKLKHFDAMAQSVLKDVGFLVVEHPNQVGEARAMLPIVLEIRKHGENLLQRRRPWMLVICLPWEVRIRPLVKDLERVEDLLRELPRSRLSLEDVLDGHFEPSTALVSPCNMRIEAP